MTAPVADDHADARFRARRTLSTLAAGILGVAVGFVLVIVVIPVTRRDNLPVVTGERLRAAIDRWDAAGPASYDLEVRVTKRQVELHCVEVRQGEVRSYTLDGRPMTRRRTFDTWSVPGMFSTVEQDVAHVQRFSQREAGPDTPRLSLWGTFHPQYGYPQRYRRIQWGSNTDVSWEVMKFDVIPSSVK